MKIKWEHPAQGHEVGDIEEVEDTEVIHQWIAAGLISEAKGSKRKPKETD